jgi:hypothetical protein
MEPDSLLKWRFLMRVFLTATLLGVGTLFAATPVEAQVIQSWRGSINVLPSNRVYVPYSSNYGTPTYQYSVPNTSYYRDSRWNDWDRGPHWHQGHWHSGYWHNGHWHSGYYHPGYLHYGGHGRHRH